MRIIVAGVIWLWAAHGGAMAKDAPWAWSFNGQDEQHATFGIAPEGAGEFLGLMGECKPIALRIPFKIGAMAELLKTDAYPLARFQIDGKAHDETIDFMSFRELGPGWQVELREAISRGFIERLANANRVRIQLAGRVGGKIRILDTYGELVDLRRKETLLQVAKECF